MKINILSLIIFIFLMNGCSNKLRNSPLPENSALSQEIFYPEEKGYKLVWGDNFDGNEIDTTKWRYRGTGPRRIGYNDPLMVKVEDGNLLLMYDIRKDSIMAGAIGTQESYMTTYGYFECRAKMQKSQGPWAAFWLQSPLISKGEDPGKFGAEIDVFEYMKEYGDTMTHAIHWAYGPNQKSSGRLLSALKGLSEGFHTFALEWTPEKYAIYMDGLKFHECTEGLSHVSEYMILSMEIPSTLEQLKKACAPDTFIVDYVKVYKK